MKRLFILLMLISFNVLGQNNYIIESQDKMVSDVLSRWSAFDNHNIKWSVTEWHNNKKYEVDFDIKDKNRLNEALKSQSNNEFKPRVRTLVSIFQSQNQDLELHLCFFEEPSDVILWVHSSPNLECSDFSSL